MATTKLLSELFKSLAVQDTTRARELATAICADAERKGHRSAARQLRSALHRNGALVERASESASLMFPTAALVPLSTEVTLADVVLRKQSEDVLAELIREWKHRERLLKRGVPLRTKLLLYGPPGCGKSLTARALGRELKLPVYVVRFDAVIGAYLGQTAIHLRQLFKYAEEHACILLLDELDALGKQRGNPLDVGELDRIVIALMQELEHSHPRGLVIGTSNLPRHLDAALWRRFDLTLEFRAPTRAGLETYAKKRAGEMRLKLNGAIMRQVLRSRSFADAQNIMFTAVRQQVLRTLA